jgi:DNA mismatch repair protein MutL
LFLNGRAIRDRALQHALGEAYRGLMLTGRQPICFLRLDMPADLVDVNVHPTKQEVRFQDSGRLYSLLLGTLRTKFLTTDLRARGASPVGVGVAENDAESVSAGASELVQWKQELGRRVEDSAPSSTSASVAPGGGHAPARFDEFARPVFDETQQLRLHRLDQPESRAFEIGKSTSEANAPATRSSWLSTPRSALQVHNRYLVVENEAGIEVIDQHALHERILYEHIREKVLAGALESQKLLVPEPVDLSATEAAAVLEHSELLGQLGVEVQPFGGETVLVSSYPAMLANLSPADVLRDLVEKLLPGGRRPEVRDLLDELLHMIACKAAVKFGDRLTAEEVEALLAQRHLVQDQHHCPHGRPTALVFTREDLDRQFKRI